MGEYLTLLTQVKNNIYTGRLDVARETFKRLLNSLNIDYNTAKNPAEKAKVRSALQKLMPSFEEMKKGMVTDVTISILSLDRSRLPARFGGYAQPVPPPPPYIPPAPTYIPPQSAAPGATAAPTWTAPAASNPGVGGQGATIEPFKPAPSVMPSKGNRVVKNNNALMPLTLNDYIGQAKAKRSLRISIGAAKKTGVPLAHLLICSSYGLGKTTLTNIIANEMGMPFFNVNATALKDVKSLSLYFSKIDCPCIVFIDEIHTLKKEVQTVLLSIMTDFTVNLIDDLGNEQHFDLPKFTLIGATTQAGELLKPFLNRFAVLELEDYTEEEKHTLVLSKFKKLGYNADDDAVYEISRRCRGVPRTIETYVKGVIDVAIALDQKVVTKEITDEYFEIHEIDGMGLTKNDIKILSILDESVKPIALITMESKTSIQREDLEFRYEPYLLKLGFIDKTMQGRIITDKGRKYLHPEIYGSLGDDADEDGGDGGDNSSPYDGADETEEGDAANGNSYAEPAELPQDFVEGDVDVPDDFFETLDENEDEEEAADTYDPVNTEEDFPADYEGDGEDGV